MAKKKSKKKQKKQDKKEKKKNKKMKVSQSPAVHSSIYNILAFTFVGQDTAKQTVDDIQASGVLEGFDIVAQAVVEQDMRGKVHIHEPGKGGIGAAVGAVGGGLLSLIGGPFGFLAWVVAGAVVGGVAGKYLGRPIAKGDLQEIGASMSPHSSAFLLLLEDKYSEQVVDSLSGYNANVITLTVGDELSGQIAAYAAGEFSTDAGETATEPDVEAEQSDVTPAET